MNPQTEFCPNQACPDRGKVGADNIVSHSQKEKRYRCKICGKTFSVTRGTALYGLKTSHETVECVWRMAVRFKQSWQPMDLMSGRCGHGC